MTSNKAFLRKNTKLKLPDAMIDNSKIWSDDHIELFLAKGKKTTYLDIEAPTRANIRSRIKNSSKFLKNLPEEEQLIGEKTAGDYANRGKIFREFFERNPKFSKL